METAFDEQNKISTEVLRDLIGKSNARGWQHVGSYLGVLMVTTIGLALTWGSWWMAPFFMAQGILLNCLYAGVHELSHNTVFRTRWLNEWFGRFFAFINLMGRDQDKLEHFQHHRYTQDVEKDAEIVGGDPFTLWTYFLYMSGISYWYARVLEVLSLAAGKTDRWPHITPPQFKTLHKEARLMTVGYALIAAVSVVTGSFAALTLWIAPMLTMKWFQMMQNTVEHTGMPHVNEIYANTRTVKAGPVMQWLFWNMPYHTAHHTYPMVPFFNLSKLHTQLVKTAGQEPQTIGHFGFQKQMIKKLRKEGTSKYSGTDITDY